MSYSKETYRTGNFVYFNKKLHLIFKKIDSIIGNVYYLISCDNQSQIHIVHEKNVQAYTRKPNGQTSASNMTEKQRICIECIEKNTWNQIQRKNLIRCFIVHPTIRTHITIQKSLWRRKESWIIWRSYTWRSYVNLKND